MYVDGAVVHTGLRDVLAGCRAPRRRPGPGARGSLMNAAVCCVQDGGASHSSLPVSQIAMVGSLPRRRPCERVDVVEQVRDVAVERP